jgi:TonB family protein
MRAPEENRPPEPGDGRLAKRIRISRTKSSLHWTGVLFCTGLLIAASAVAIQAQQADSARKVVYKVAPKYPQDLKKNGIGGVVRLSIMISPRGSVDKVSPVGGNAALVDAAAAAVKQWKYVPASSSTSTEVQFDFIPGRQ